MNVQMPLFQPTSDWVPPSEFPEFSKEPIIGIDLETKDPNLIEKGPGSFRKDGYPVGVSIATANGFKGYYPFAHAFGGNMDKDVVLNWLRSELAKDTGCVKVGANILYDIEWLDFLGVKVVGPIVDIQVAEPLLDEESPQGYSLEVLAKKYLGDGKDESLLKQAAQAFGINAKADMWQLPPKYVGPYAEADAQKTLQIFLKQLERLKVENLMQVFNLECDLIPLIWEMRKLGVRVNVDEAKRLSGHLASKEKEALIRLKNYAGFEVNPWAAEDLVKVCTLRGLGFNQTDAGNPSFTAEWLKVQDNPFFKDVLEFRKVGKLRRDFIDGMILGNMVDGRIHAQFHQLRKDDSGTRSGRFSSSSPNLQQVPARDEDWGPMIRGLFIPEEGCQWAKLDYSQQEPRIAVHYANILKCNGVEQTVNAYRENPDTDFYELLTKAAGITRRMAKDTTLGRMYGMGIRKFAIQIKRSESEAKEIMNQFDTACPFVKELSFECLRVANTRGYIRTWSGRRRRFNLWEPDNMPANGGLPLFEAKEAWPDSPLKRAFTYKALNSLIQGTAADMTKQAMLDIWKDKKMVPHFPVHDELDFSVSRNEDGIYAREMMEKAVELTVPIKAELSIGGSWGTTEEVS